MSKSKKQEPKTPDTEGKYERICNEYMERDELEALNRKVEERNAWIERMMYEHDKQLERTRMTQERRINAIGKLVVAILLAVAIITSLGVLAYMGAFSWPVSIVCGGAILLISTFYAGYFWHDIKGERAW